MKKLTTRIPFKASALALTMTLAGCAVSPKPLQQAELASNINQDLANLYHHQQPVTDALSLYDVMARALQYNLEFRTEQLSERLANGQFELARYDMLPTLTAEAGKMERSNVDASVSRSIYSNKISEEPSTSEEQFRGTANLKFSWNVLDFGVSYLQAKQEADRFLIAEANRRTASQVLLSQARTTYWQALAAQELEAPLQAIYEDALAYLAQLDEGLSLNAFRKPLEVLQLKRQLLVAIQELESLQADLEYAQTSLASLINTPLDKLPRLQPMARTPLPALDQYSTEVLELTALNNSNDLLGQHYNTRIEQLEGRKAILRLLPGLEFGYNHNYDENRFLHHHQWGEASARVTWNLLRLASGPQSLENAELRQQLAAQRRLAVTMAVITQLNLAQQQITDADRQFKRSAVLSEIDQQIAEQTAHKVASQAGSEVERIQSRVTSLMAQVGYWWDYADLQDAYGIFLDTMGLFPAPDNYSTAPLEELSSHIQHNLEQWNQGQLPLFDPATAQASQHEDDEG